jgi:hypothetical protein
MRYPTAVRNAEDRACAPCQRAYETNDVVFRRNLACTPAGMCSTSTRRPEDAFKDENGRLLLSNTAASQLGERLWGDYQAFAQVT